LRVLVKVPRHWQPWQVICALFRRTSRRAVTSSGITREDLDMEVVRLAKNKKARMRSVWASGLSFDLPQMDNSYRLYLIFACEKAAALSRMSGEGKFRNALKTIPVGDG
jgi:hypothetical protein